MHTKLTIPERLKDLRVVERKLSLQELADATGIPSSTLGNYEKDENLDGGVTANNINVKYSALQNTSYKYDEERKVYLRSMRGIEHRDSQTNEQFYAKNIIMIYVKDELLDDPEDKGRRELYNIGTGKGYFATNGQAIEITWEKKTREGKTVYKDLSGKEITINDGITWVQIVPVTGKITIE